MILEVSVFREESPVLVWRVNLQLGEKRGGYPIVGKLL